MEDFKILPVLAPAPPPAGGSGQAGDPADQQRAEPCAHPVHAAPLVHGDRGGRQGGPGPEIGQESGWVSWGPEGGPA